MDPFSATAIAAVSAGASAGGGILSAFGQSQSGDANASMYTYRAGIAKMNAQIQRQNSNFALEAGDANARRSGMSTGFTIAKEKVAQAGNGFDVNSGTNSDVRDSQREIGLIDQTTIRTEASRKALGFRNTAAGLDAEATGDIMAADNSRKAGRIAAVGTLLGTAGSVASKWMTASQTFGAGSGSGITLYGPDQNVTGWRA